MGEVLGDEVMAPALIDRFLHHCHLINIRGNSYRMRAPAELRRTLQSNVAPEPAKHSRKPKGCTSLSNSQCAIQPPQLCSFHPALTHAEGA
jgi:hypothetical protein